METTITLDAIREKLKAGGYDGLLYPGECACELKDLAPCGECQQQDGEDYINGCDPGYKHLDPRPEHQRYGDFIISVKKIPPTDEEWDNITYG